VDRTPWGRYGVQYFYGCPDCGGTVLPGVFPAASIIDRSLPAPLIRDREKPLAKNTRERIRRGLERLASEPFAIRLLQSGTPKPLTLPIVTLTQRHDMAMVTPVAGNTFERKPGNRARDARTTPLATVHGTPEQALVVPPMGDVAARDAHARPLPTQTTTTRSALVMANTENGVPRPDHEATQTLRTEGGLALVMANRMHCLPRPADESPSPTACTGETLGVVHLRGVAELQRHGDVKDATQSPVHMMRNNDGPNGQMCTPEHEPIRTVATKGHQSILVPYDRTGSPVLADQEPAMTLTTRDRAAVIYTDDDVDACGFRMFALHEIAAAMAMDDHVDGNEYVVLGNKRERMAQYGNAVTPPVITQLVARLLPILDEASAA
jgi:DNA (cytosine-5)-methyltransferase 1